MYLDYNATTPVDERVIEAMTPYLGQYFGNPSSVHRYGRVTRAAIDQARQQIAALVNAHESQVIFTSGGTEANNLALKGCLWQQERGMIAHSAIEHASVLATAKAMQMQGWRREQIAVDKQGRINTDSLQQILALKPDLVSVMQANNETGVLQQLDEITQQVRAQGALMHTDAVQAVGKIKVDFKGNNLHMMSLSAHKIYGPKGSGALIVDKAIDLQPMQHGGGHERGYRTGTENLAGIVGFGKAAELAMQELDARVQKILPLRDKLQQGLLKIPGVVIYSGQAERVPNTVQAGIPGFDGEALLMELDKRNIAVSSGSACSSGYTEASHVLQAMHAEPTLARSAIRISLGKDSTEQQVQNFLAQLVEILQRVA